jgi:dGTPase
MMEWQQLLTDERFRSIKIEPRSHEPPVAKKENPVTTFQEDIERILYSSAFRRLQNKTQVHPLPNSDYYRTRLTHSLEVAQVARIIGTSIGRYLLEEWNALPDGTHPADIGDIVYAACLAHDIGNPPFGHNGEYAIQSWFEENQKHNSIVAGALADEQKRYDLLNFDGNAQMFRILTRLQEWRRRGGLQLSCAVMGASAKYPFSSKVGHEHYQKKKFGFMQDDADGANKIFRKLDLPRLDANHYARHPLAFICEAADDICYRATDIEDGVKAGIIPFSKGERLLKGIAAKKYRARYDDIDLDDDKIKYLRSTAISTLIDAAYATFLDRYDDIMSGKCEPSLLEACNYAKQLNAIAQECRDTLYVERRKMETEAAGYHVIHFLLDKFGGMLAEYSERGVSRMSRKSENLFYLFPKDNLSPVVSKDHYKLCCYLVDFVSGMSDRHAVDLFKKISGLSISIGQ